MWRYTNLDEKVTVGLHDKAGKMHKLAPGKSITIDEKYEPATYLEVKEVKK